MSEDIKKCKKCGKPMKKISIFMGRKEIIKYTCKNCNYNELKR